jgi:HSP20 family protein
MFALIPKRHRGGVNFPVTGPHEEFKTLYDRFFNSWPALFEGYTEPVPFWGLELKDAEKEMVVRAELPGFEPEEMEVEFRENGLMIRAAKKHEMEEKEAHEFARYRYERFVELPVPIMPEKAEAFYRNGVLEVHLPKAAEATIRRIPVK